MAILIVAEHDNHTIQAATLSVLTAATEIAAHTSNSELHLLIIGHNCQPVVDIAQGIPGLSQILVADHQIYQYPLAENIAPLIVSLVQDHEHREEGGNSRYTHIITSAGTTGKDYQPRVAALLDVAQISDIISVESADTFKRPIYAGNAIATVQSSDLTQVITVRSSAFVAVSLSDLSLSNSNQVPVVELAAQADSGKSEFINAELTQSSRPELTTAKVVIAGGRGMQNADNFMLLDTLADQLNAAVGASRAAVDAGFVANDLQIGQTGKIVAPDLYIAVGISGAIQHIAGITGSKVIVAINSDPDAPIFDVADYGLVADLFDVLPALTTILKAKE
ncbi:electron transfer flavoprotein subunit alpha/FixB family protein [Moritella sp. Urea-trap-13]|uniref:electron transfer flavoprotein subunit alpha/FixB family protein n=1 Tax=Moritella sp. Urea-trap-13 TaxID=2058327 RepID=UPI000C331E16|nr:FAD-binding protein [Moritella sp. Urea-trap-13]PKH06792.1 electron transfer flavoprotein subunit alpha [Moritella sp. Urea-trap-13]